MDAFSAFTHALADPSLYKKIQEKLLDATSISNSYYTGLRSKREQFILDLADASEKVQAHLIPLLQVLPPQYGFTSLSLRSVLPILILLKTWMC